MPKLRVGGCLAAHDVYPGLGRRGMTGDFSEFITSQTNLETTVTPGGLSISRKRRELPGVGLAIEPLACDQVRRP